VSRPIIALLTDFGLRDHYVAAMKGVILDICREAMLVDISHDVDPHDIAHASLELAACRDYFPPDTIFLVVVDPGVGSQRRAIAVDVDGRRYVAPDNGVLSGVLGAEGAVRAFEITNLRYARPTVSKTFEGRDRFAPAAAWLATGVDIASLGSAIRADGLHRLHESRAVQGAEGISGEVMRVDRFGNLVTNIDREMLDELRRAGSISVSVDGDVAAPLVATYADVPAGALCALLGSSNHLEIAANGTSAAVKLGLSRGARVRVIISAARD
jgi:S-adenosylmethionine hydrolase